MKVCFDFDGTFTTNGGFGASRIKIPSWILKAVFTVYTPKINKKTLNLMINYKENGENVIIITARPQALKELTWKYIQNETTKCFPNKKTPVDEIFFVGPGIDSRKRKIKKAKEEKVELFFDNCKKTLNEAKNAGIKVLSVN